MKSLVRKSLGLLVGLSLTFTLTACGETAPEVDEGKLLQQGVYNLLNSGSMRFSVVVEGEVAEAATTPFADVSMTANGAFSSLEEDESGVEVNVVFVADSDEGEYEVDVAVKVLEEKLYLKLLGSPIMPDLPAGLFDEMVGVWWMIDGPPTDGFGLSVPGFEDFAKGYDDVDEIAQAARDLLLDYSFFKDISFDGSEDVEGMDTYRYSVAFDTDQISEFAYAKRALSGAEMTPEEKTSLEEFLASVSEFTGYVWVDKSSETLVRVGGPSFGLADLSGEIEVTFYDIDQPFSVKAPVDYEVFDLGVFLGAFVSPDMMGIPAE